MKNIISTFLFITFLLCVSCTVSNKFSTEVSTNAKNLIPPEGKSIIYVYRVSSLGFAVGLKVSLNNTLLGNFYPKQFYLCTLDPGKYIITGFGENEDDIILTTEAGKKYYIEARPNMGWASARIALELHDQIAGNNAIQRCKMIGSTNTVIPIAKKIQP